MFSHHLFLHIWNVIIYVPDTPGSIDQVRISPWMPPRLLRLRIKESSLGTGEGPQLLRVEDFGRRGTDEIQDGLLHSTPPPFGSAKIGATVLVAFSGTTNVLARASAYISQSNEALKDLWSWLCVDKCGLSRNNS